MTESKRREIVSYVRPIVAIFTVLLVHSESIVSIETFLTERRFVFCSANKCQLSFVVMSASAKTNYLIFAAFVAFLSISTLPQLSRGQSECFMVKWSLYFRGSRPKPKGTHKYRASLDIEFAQLSLRNIAMLAASVWFTCNIQSP